MWVQWSSEVNTYNSPSHHPERRALGKRVSLQLRRSLQGLTAENSLLIESPAAGTRDPFYVRHTNEVN